MNPTRSRRRSISVLAAAVACSMVVTFAVGGAASAASSAQTGSGKGKAVATLEILKPNVSVQRSGKDVFKPAKEGQKLRVGDTVQTDATGFAQVNYTDESLTRLNVNTTFTIVSLTDDEGNRTIKGSVESGQTWNRTTALTESESFEQEGAGATAAVTGTAFAVQCDDEGVCTFTSVVDGIQLTTVDGEIVLMNPLEQCDSTEISETDANLCAEVAQLTAEAALANQWILANLYLDGLAGFEGIIVIEDGVVVSITTTTGGSTATEDPPATAPPIIDPDNPVLVEDCEYAYPGDVCSEDLGASSGSPSPVPDTPAPGLYSYNGDNVFFAINSSAGPSGLPWFLMFVDLPDAGFGTIYHDNGFGYGPLVDLITQYAPDSVFRFEAYGDGGATTDTMTVKVVNAEAESAPTEIPITVEYDSCGGSVEGAVAADC